MPVDIPTPNQDDMMSPGDGWLSYEYMHRVWHMIDTIANGGKVSVPPGWGSASMLFSEENWVLDLTKLTGQEVKPHPLQLVAQPTGIWVVNGTVSGALADFTMGAARYIILTADLNDGDWIWSAVGMAWNAGNVRRLPTGTNAIDWGASPVPTPTNTFGYMPIGQISKTGSVVKVTTQSVSGSQTIKSSGVLGNVNDAYNLQ